MLKIWVINNYREDSEKYNSLFYSYLNTVNFNEISEEKSKDEKKSYLNYINEYAYRIYSEHTMDIISLAWSLKYQNYVITVSFDFTAVLYDINEAKPLKIYKHKDSLSSVSFFPNIRLTLKNENINTTIHERDDYFIVSCFNFQVFIWNIYNNDEPFFCIHVNETITAVCVFPDCTRLCLGSAKGNVYIHDIYNNFRYEYSFHVKNKNIKTSLGRKITSIKFINNTNILISTNDDRIRIINIKDGNVVQKFKGHQNNEGMLKCFYNENYDMIIAPSEDYYVYLWKFLNKNKLNKKNYNYTYFQPTYTERKEFCTETLCITEKGVGEYNQKLFNCGFNIFVKNIIILTTSKGYIHILLDYFPISDEK